jgi:hypothetical protein
LARVNQIRIADLLPVRLVNDGIARAHTISEPAEAPEAIAAGDGGGCDLRQDHGGGRASAWQSGRHGGRQLRLLRDRAIMQLALRSSSTVAPGIARPAITASPVGSMRAISNAGRPSPLSGGIAGPASAAATAFALACAAATAAGS